MVPREKRSLRSSASLPSTISGRHVVGRADQRAGHGHPLVGGEDAGDAEVGQLHRRALALLDHDVLGLQVAVDDAGGVGVGEGVGQRPADEQADLGIGEADLLGEGPQGLAADELGHQVGLRRAVPGVVVDLDDARVGEAGHGARLPGEAGPALGGLREVRVEQLDRHLAIERGVAAAVDDGHAAAPDLLEQLVAPQAS